MTPWPRRLVSIEGAGRWGSTVDVWLSGQYGL